ncbi:MAG: HAD family hydrolase, partial [Pseudomonadota bacterium]
QDILANGRDLLAHPVELLPGVHDTLAQLAGSFRLIMVTKGDLLHQEEKLAASGLGDLFSDVHIVSQKDPGTYSRIFTHPQQTMMVGNSMKSDILPVINIGGWATFVPFHIEWALERAERPEDHPRFRQIETIDALPNLLAELA